MADQDNKREIKLPEKRTLATDQEVHFDWDKEKKSEKREISEDDAKVSAQLRREIDAMELSPELHEEAKKASQKIQFFGEEEKLSHLIKIAEEKGIIYAVKVAKNMNESYILDKLHDIFVENDYYKKFLK